MSLHIIPYSPSNAICYPPICAAVIACFGLNDTPFLDYRSRETTPNYRDASRLLDETLEQMSLPYDTVVYRGTQADRVRGLGGSKGLIQTRVPIRSWRDQPLATVANTSTSLLRDTSYPGEVEMIILIPEERAGAGYVNEISYNYLQENSRSEYEVILHRNSRYRKIEAQSYNGKYFVVVQWDGYEDL